MTFSELGGYDFLAWPLYLTSNTRFLAPVLLESWWDSHYRSVLSESKPCSFLPITKTTANRPQSVIQQPREPKGNRFIYVYIPLDSLYHQTPNLLLKFYLHWWTTASISPKQPEFGLRKGHEVTKIKKRLLLMCTQHCNDWNPWYLNHHAHKF